MSSYTFDVETNGLLDHLTEIKCLNVTDNGTGEELRFTDYPFYLDAHTGLPTDDPTPRQGTILDGLLLLEEASEICGHNICGFDIPAIQKVYPEWKPKGAVFDTAAVSRLLFVDIQDRDFSAIRKGKLKDMPKNLIGTHKLAAWGYRLGGEHKGDFLPSSFGWTWDDYPFSKECDDYCMQDVRTNVGLVTHLKNRIAEMNWSMESVELEQAVVTILQRQMDYGWLYDIDAAHRLVAELQKEKIALEDRLQEAFPPFYKKVGGLFTPKRDNAKLGYIAGVPVQKVVLTQFNPGSRDHVSSRLIDMYGWAPEKFTPEGKPKIDETVLSELPYAEAKLCSEYFTVNKKIGQVSDGKSSQLKLVKSDGRMRGYVNHNGAVTGRMTHSRPNVAQTDTDPRVRALYIVSPGKKLVGCDADGIEGRCLGHYLAPSDGGAYIKVILEGSKDDGTDLHSRNRDAVGLNSRNNAKTIFYAWMYGAGDYKLGTVVYEDWPTEKQERFNARYSGDARNQQIARIGGRARAALVAGIAGMKQLIDKVKAKSKTPGYVIGLDGRRVYTRSAHAALNTLLQSAGALIMKKSLVLLDTQLQADGLVPGIHYEFVGNIHDELQIECEESHATAIGTAAAAAIAAAGEHFKFRCPLSGSYAIGDNWSETH